MEPDRRKMLTIMAGSRPGAVVDAAPTPLRSNGPRQRAPQLKAPAQCCDCQIISSMISRFRDRRGIPFPGDALVEDYRALQRALGNARQVVIQPSTYGADNRVTSMRPRRSGMRRRAVVVVTTAFQCRTAANASAGESAAPFQFRAGGPTTPEMIERLSHRIGDLGWHIEADVWAPSAGDNPSSIACDRPLCSIISATSRA